MIFSFNKKQKGLSNAGGLIIIAILLALIALVFVAASAIIGGYTSDVGSDKPLITADSSIAPVDTSGTFASCSDIITSAKAYLGSGIVYGHCGCGSSTTGPSGVSSGCIDCSGFVTRVYRDAGLMPKDSCFYTVTLAQTSLLKRIATNETTARSLMQPGDILLFGLGDPSGSPDHGDNSHAVIYGGKSGSLDIVYESGGHGPKGTGPHVSTYNIFRGRQLYGLYRTTQTCKSSSTTK